MATHWEGRGETQKAKHCVYLLLALSILVFTNVIPKNSYSSFPTPTKLEYFIMEKMFSVTFSASAADCDSVSGLVSPDGRSLELTPAQQAAMKIITDTTRKMQPLVKLRIKE